MPFETANTTGTPYYIKGHHSIPMTVHISGLRIPGQGRDGLDDDFVSDAVVRDDLRKLHILGYDRKRPQWSTETLFIF